MPTLIVDTEQAELIGVAVEMLQAALRARAARANPEKIITDSLQLQANKLETVLAELKAPEPPDWSQLSAEVKRSIKGTIEMIAANPGADHLDKLYRQLRRLVITPGFPPAPTQG